MIRQRSNDLKAIAGDTFYDEYTKELNRRGVYVTVSQAPNKPQIPTDVIAQDIRAISELMKQINAGRLNKKALLVLLSHASGLAQKDVKNLLDSLTDLGKLYLKP